MDRRRRDDITAIAAQIDPLRNAGTVTNESARMGEIEVPAAAAGRGLDCCRQRLEASLQTLERNVAAMIWIDIEHDQI